MKKGKLVITVLASLMAVTGLVGCGNKGGGDTPTPTPTPVETDYKIMINAPTGIEAKSDKERAKKGEEVTITIVSVAASYTISSVTMNDTNLTAASENVYKFVMPNQSALVKINVSVSGDVVITGDAPVALTKNETTGIYEAKNFLVVNGTKSYANISFKVGETVLDYSSFNVYKSFGDIQLGTGSGQTLSIATQSYYDFYYDPANATEGPCYIQRVGVKTLPTDASSLGSLLVISPGPGYEYCANIPDLKEVDYTVINMDGSTTADYINQVYNWKKYSNDITFATIKDTNQMMEEETLYVYKEIDRENKEIEVVDTYGYKKNNLIANDDPNREDYNNYGSYSARYNIVNGDDYDVRRYSRNVNRAENMFTMPSHNPAHYVEREFYASYRAGVTVEDDVTYANVVIASNRNADESFVTTINTTIEKNYQGSSSSSSYHNAYVHKITLNFDKRGALTKLDMEKRQYSILSGSSGSDEWDTTTHQPKAGVKGTRVKYIKANYTYGEITEEINATQLADAGFNKDNYFLKSVSALQIYDPNSKQDKTTGKSYLHLGADLSLLSISPTCKLDSKVINFKYEPATALDLWEYGVTNSSNEAVIKKEANDTYNQVSAVGVGTSTVTFSNHHVGAGEGITFTLDVEVVSVTKVREFLLYDEESPYDAITYAVVTTVKSGTTHKFTVVPYPYESPAAPCIYTAVSSDSNVAKVTSAKDAKTLVIEFGKVTQQTKVTITMNADYDSSYSSSPTIFTFYVLTTDADPTGTWGLLDYETEAICTFTGDPYQESSTKKVGTFSDTYGSKSVTGTFYYEFDGLKLTGKVTSITITGSSESWSTDPNDYIIEFQYDAPTGYYGIGLCECVYDEYYESVVYSAIWGECDDDGFVSYDPFRKLN